LLDHPSNDDEDDDDDDSRTKGMLGEANTSKSKRPLLPNTRRKRVTAEL
jgi:hypothetical protein